MFDKLSLKFRRNNFDKTIDISKTQNSEFNLPLVNAKDGDNGVMYYGREKDFESAEMCIDIVNDGAISTGNVYSQIKKTGVLYNAYLIKPNFKIKGKTLHFLTTSIFKSIKPKFGYENKAGWEKVKNEKIQLPTKNSEIDFEFMEQFISQLENERLQKLDAYLSATGLNNYQLIKAEQQALVDFESGDTEWGEFKYKDIFNNIKQGRRLTKDDQLKGNIPFVMAGTTNTGVVNYISNPIATFPENSITVDIFGNTFYRNYSFGAGDDTGVYWSNEKEYSKENMLFFTTAIQKSILGKFDYGNKLRSSQSLDFEIKVPTKNNQPDYEYMQNLISAIQKQVIQGVVEYSSEKQTQAIA